jgi:GntR family transcriptional regulator
MSTLPIRLSETSGVPFYRQVQDQLTALIQSGELPPGTCLPSVRELSRDTLVSLITIRRAYAELDQAGLIVRKQGQGTFVADRVDAVSADHARAGAKDRLREAVVAARQAGLDEDAIWGIVARALRELG